MATTTSLDIDEKNDKLLVTCRVGCAQEAVIAALKARGLWNDRKERTLKSIVWTPASPTIDTPNPPSAHPKRGKPNALWVYRAAQGLPFAADYRFDLPGGKKDVLPCTWCESDGGARSWRFVAAKRRPILGWIDLPHVLVPLVLLVSGAMR